MEMFGFIVTYWCLLLFCSFDFDVFSFFFSFFLFAGLSKSKGRRLSDFLFLSGSE